MEGGRCCILITRRVKHILFRHFPVTNGCEERSHVVVAKYGIWADTVLAVSTKFEVDSDRASSLICGSKMPTRCNR